MKLKTALTALAIVAMTVAAAPATWANSLTFQNVTFDLSLNGAGNLNLTITNALNAGPDWTGIDHLEAFAINQYGTATGLQSTGWTAQEPPDGLGSGGCTGSGNFACFNGQSFALINSFSFEITKTGGTFSLDNPPSLKVLFSGADVPNGHGSLLSQPIPANVPEPASLMLLGAGLAGIGIWRRWSMKI